MGGRGQQQMYQGGRGPSCPPLGGAADTKEHKQWWHEWFPLVLCSFWYNACQRCAYPSSCIKRCTCESLHRTLFWLMWKKTTWQLTVYQESRTCSRFWTAKRPLELMREMLGTTILKAQYVRFSNVYCWECRFQLFKAALRSIYHWKTESVGGRQTLNF